MYNTLRIVAATLAAVVGLFTVKDAGAQAASFTVLKVTSLADSGPGTLRDCAEKAYPRVCVFEVSGRIKLSTVLTIKEPDLVIAGQTAPSPGILITNAGIVIRARDVRIEHLAVRVGDSPTGPDPARRDSVSIQGTGAYRIKLKNLSISWGVDHNLSIYGGAKEVFVENTIISEALWRSINPGGPRGYGALVAEGARNIRFVNDLLAANQDRNVRWRYDSRGEMINNVIYGWGGTTSWNTTNITDNDNRDIPTYLDVIGNVFIPGPQGYPTAYAVYTQNTPSGSKLYLSDNIAPRQTNVESSYLVSSRILTGPAPISSAQTYDVVIANVGSRPWDRNPDDVRVIAGVKAKTLGLRDAVGTWPTYAENRRTITINDGLITRDRLNEALTGFESNVASPMVTASPTPFVAPTSTPAPTTTSTPLPTVTPQPTTTATATPVPSTPTPLPTAFVSSGKTYTVVRVTSLADSGAGTLRDCASKAFPRICVFETSGRINLMSDLLVSQPDAIIAGQTAPSPGILITGAALVVTSHDVRVEHLALRSGDLSTGPAPTYRRSLSVKGAGAYNVTLKNLSVSWGIDENFNTYQNVKNVRMESCIVSEALHNSLHPKGPHSMGLLVNETARNVTFVNNLIAANNDRNIRWKSDSQGEMINNVIYGWGGTSSWNLTNISDVDNFNIPTYLDVIGNVFIPGPQGVQNPYNVYSQNSPTGSKVFLHDNIGQQATNIESIYLVKTRVLPGPTPIPASQTYETVLARVGARPWDRNADDIRVIAGVRNRTLRIRDKVGTWPVYAVNKRAVTLLGSSATDTQIAQALTKYESGAM